MIDINAEKYVYATFGSGNTTRTKPVYRHDRGRICIVRGLDLPPAYQVHWHTSQTGSGAIPQWGSADGVRIPDSLIDTGKTVYGWIYINDAEAGVTIKTIIIPVLEKPIADGAEPEPEEADIIAQAIDALNTGVRTVQDIAEAMPGEIRDALAEAKASGEFDGPQGPQGEKGDKGDTGNTGAQGPKGDTGATGDQGPKGDKGDTGPVGQDGADGADGQDGYTPVRGTDYWTAADKAEIVGDAVNELDAYVVRYDESQQLTETQKETARENVGAAPDTLTDEVHALHGLEDYQPEFGQISGTNYATVTRIGDVININGTHGGGTVAWRGVLNGEFAAANSSSAFAALGHAGLMLIEDHKYSAKLTYISGSATRAAQNPNEFCFLRVYKNGTDDPPVTPADVAYTLDANGKSHECTFTYDSSLTDGILLTLAIQRANGNLPTFSDYRFVVTLEDITDATETHGIPSGGTAGQVLTKVDGVDYNAEWTTPQGGGVSDVQVNGTSVVSGGVANIPVAGDGVFGAVKLNTAYGLYRGDNTLRVLKAADSDVKAGTNAYKPIVPSTQDASAFYGLAKAASDTTQSASSNAVGQYTESAKSAIHTMLNGSVSVTGTTPTITALPGIRYICGEVSTLDITLPASGCIDVVFESGSTPTVLTVTPPSGVTVKWANSFDPTALDADTTYEINVCDGLGVAGSWT